MFIIYTMRSAQTYGKAGEVWQSHSNFIQNLWYSNECQMMIPPTSWEIE